MYPIDLREQWIKMNKYTEQKQMDRVGQDKSNKQNQTMDKFIKSDSVEALYHLETHNRLVRKKYVSSENKEKQSIAKYTNKKIHIQ